MQVDQPGRLEHPRPIAFDGDVITVDVLATTPADSVDELMELLADEWLDLHDEE